METAWFRVLKEAVPPTPSKATTKSLSAHKSRYQSTVPYFRSVQKCDRQTHRSESRPQRWAERFADSGASLFNCVYIDESPSNLHQHVSYGRTKRGERDIRSVASDRGKNITYIAALGQEGVIADWAHQGSTTSTLFAWFLKTKVFPKLSFGRRIIMDNGQVHNGELVRDAFAESPHQAVFLPPYSPFLNAAEWFFAQIKPRLSKEEYKDTESLFRAIRSSTSSVTAAHCVAWIREVNRNLHRAMNGEILGREHHYNMAEGDEDLAGQLLQDLENLQVLA